MCMHVRMLNANWKYCQVEIQNVFIRAETMILWKRSEMSRNKKFNRISLYLVRNSNIKLKFSVTGKRINHSYEISRILIMYNICIIIKCCWSFNYSKCLIALIHVHQLPRVLSYDDVLLYMPIIKVGDRYL